MSTVSTLLDYIKDDIKESGATRDAEIRRYMDRVIRQAIVPTLVRFRSTLGLTEWITDELVEYVREISLPTGFLAMHTLYRIDVENEGTAQSAAGSTLTLASDASSSNDAYNAMQLRINGGTGNGQQRTITDYVGSTVTATVDTTWTTTPNSTSEYIVFKEPSPGNELTQREAGWVRVSYNTISSVVCYGIENSTIVLGGIPDSTTRVLWGWYWATPSALSANSSTVPFYGIFDDVIIEYSAMRCLNRDEYNVQMERALLEQAIDGVSGILVMRRSRTDRQPKVSGSEDL